MILTSWSSSPSGCLVLRTGGTSVCPTPSRPRTVSRGVGWHALAPAFPRTAFITLGGDFSLLTPLAPNLTPLARRQVRATQDSRSRETAGGARACVRSACMLAYRGSLATFMLGRCATNRAEQPRTRAGTTGARCDVCRAPRAACASFQGALRIRLRLPLSVATWL